MSVAGYMMLIFTGLLFSAFFAGTETAVLSVDVLELKRRRADGSKKADKVLSLLENRDLVLATLLLGNNLTVVGVSVLATALLSIRFGDAGPHLATAVITPVILVFCEILPKAVILSRSVPLLLMIQPLVKLIVRLTYPVSGSIVFLLRRMMPQKNNHDEKITRDDIRNLVMTGSGKPGLSLQEQKMIQRIFDFKEKRVKHAMVPLMDVVSIPENATAADAFQKINAAGYSRLPVYRDMPDNIIGVLLASDLLRIQNRKHIISHLVHPPLIIPEQRRVIDLLPQIWGKNEMAIVVDEYGVAVGMITAEDLVEEVLGDIQDEYDAPKTQDIIPITDTRFVIDSGMHVDEFNERIGNVIPPGDYITVAGFLETLEQRIPERGELIRTGNVSFRILEATPQRLLKILVEIARDDSSGFQK